MSSSDYNKRFGSVERLYGKQQAALFPKLHICVVGLGGVGSWAVEALARMGIGQMTMIDYDTVCLTNVNRQIHALTDTVEQKKSEALVDRVRQINPDCQCHVIDDYLTIDNVRDYLSPEHGYDYVIDAIDSIKFKAAIIYQCKRNKIPVITTGGAGGLTDPTKIAVKDLTRTWNDPLAAKVRAKLRSDYGYSKTPKRYFGVECVFSTQQPLYPNANGEVGHCKPGIHGISLDCSMGYGSATHVTATFGFVAAGRAIDKILKKYKQAK
jgi:tRNA A37 threonylcarbamoyladenosine dehydratase